jgi:hypothetical protein
MLRKALIRAGKLSFTTGALGEIVPKLVGKKYGNMIDNIILI